MFGNQILKDPNRFSSGILTSLPQGFEKSTFGNTKMVDDLDQQKSSVLRIYTLTQIFLTNAHRTPAIGFPQ